MATNSPSSVPVICPKHHTEDTAHCNWHNVTMCIDCLMDNHRNCMKQTIKLGNEVESAISLTESYNRRLNDLRTEFSSQINENTKSIQKLDDLNISLKGDILCVRKRLIEKVNILSGDALQLATSVVGKHKLLAETDIRTLDILTTKLETIQTSMKQRLGKNSSGMIGGLSFKHADILQIEEDYKRLKESVGNVKVEFIINPSIPNFVDNLISLGEIRVDNGNGQRRNSCLYVTPADTKRLSEASTSELNVDKIFVYKAATVDTKDKQPYRAMDELLSTGNRPTNINIRPPPPIPCKDRNKHSIPEEVKPYATTPCSVKTINDRPTDAGRQSTKDQTSVQTHMGGYFNYAASNLYDQPSTGDDIRKSPLTRHAIWKQNPLDTRKAKLDESNTRNRENNQSKRKTDCVDSHPVVLRKGVKTIRTPDFETRYDSSVNIPSRIPMQTMPNIRITNTPDDSNDARNAIHNTKLSKASEIDRLRANDQVVVMPQTLSDYRPNGSRNKKYSGDIVTECHEMHVSEPYAAIESPIWESSESSIQIHTSYDVPHIPNKPATPGSGIRQSVGEMYSTIQEQHSDMVMTQKGNGGCKDQSRSSSLIDIPSDATYGEDISILPHEYKRIGRLHENNGSVATDNNMNNYVDSIPVQVSREGDFNDTTGTDARVRSYVMDQNSRHAISYRRRPLSSPLKTRVSVPNDTPGTCRSSYFPTSVKTFIRCPGFRIPIFDDCANDKYLVTGMAITADGYIIMCLYNQHKIQMYDRHGYLKDIYILPNPYGACSIRGNTIAVTSHDRTSVCIFHVVDNKLIFMQEEKLSGTRDVYSISYSNRFFCVSSLDKVLILTDTLRLYRTVYGTPERFQSKQSSWRILFSNVYSTVIALSRDELRIYISDFKQERVSCIDIDGQVHWTHFICSPTSIVTYLDRVFVGTKRKIVVLSAKTGRFIREITDGVPKHPWALAINNKGLLVF